MRYLVPLLLVGLVASSAEIDGFDERDRAAVTARVDSYVAAWRANDAARVCANFTPDAVLMPHHGVEPVVGMEAIKKFWWPPSPPTTVTRFENTADEIAGTADMAFVRGHFVLEYASGSPGQEKRFKNAGTFVMLMRKRAGEWLITHHMWDDPPPQ
jgi:uncharacterized protein (TIGR02246 family)